MKLAIEWSLCCLVVRYSSIYHSILLRARCPRSQDRRAQLPRAAQGRPRLPASLCGARV
jgi:hypothetical protein